MTSDTGQDEEGDAVRVPRSLEEFWSLDRKEFLEYWNRCEQVAVHFNELNAKFRLQALAGLAVAGAVVGAVLKVEDHSGDWALAGALWGLLAAWLAVAWIDGWYYGRLLRGAVREIVKIEKATSGVLTMSTEIEAACTVTPCGKAWRSSRIGRVGFYIFPGLALVLASVFVLVPNDETATHADAPQGPVRHSSASTGR